MSDRKPTAGASAGHRLIALVGPAGAGKTSLAEALLHAAGETSRLGRIDDGNTVGDTSEEARARGGSTQLNLLHFSYLGDEFSILDAPGTVGFSADAQRGIAASDLAIVVVDPDPARAPLAAPALRMLDELGVPHLVFVNRIDQAHGSISELLEALQPMSVSPLIARQLPILDGDKVTGFVDLALERAFEYQAGTASNRVEIPEGLQAEETSARTHLLEQLADHDDTLLEQLLMDETPEVARIFADLHHETEDNLGVSVLFGSATGEWGVRRLLKALRHDGPTVDTTERRLGVEAPALYGFKISHAGAVGKLMYARAFGDATLAEGDELATAKGADVKLGAILAVQGDKTDKIGSAARGQTVAVAKTEGWKAGDWVAKGAVPPAIEVDFPARNAALAIEPSDRKDDVRLSSALARIIEEDAGLGIEQDGHEIRLTGISEDHVKTALQRLENRYGVSVRAKRPQVAYRTSIRRKVEQRGRHKKQSGGHGQYGDVVIEIAPLPRGEGFRFEEKVKGGTVPRQYFPAVEAGVKDAMEKGPLGFPVVDVAVTLLDGSYHSVDSSELAFRTAGRLAMQEALAAASPHLLEPMHQLTVVCPSSASSKVSSALASRRGQMLGMVPRDGWDGWDRIDMMLPTAELGGLEAELRALSQGLATYEAEYDHLAELNGHLADQIVAREKEDAPA